jgi:N-acetylmuramoyl-L-alanine amidase
VDARGDTRPIAQTILPVVGKMNEPRRTDESSPVLPASVPVSGSAPAVPPLTIVLDPGHGGKDPGAKSARGLLEKDVVLHIARDLAKRLERDGYRVVLTRDGDVFVPLNERTACANKTRAALFVSIHANASRNHKASGIETYYLSNTNDRATIRLARMENHLAYMAGVRPESSDVSYIVSDMIQRYKVGESRHFARLIQRSLVERTRVRHPSVSDLGVKPGPFAVLVGAGMPAVLVEVSFLSNSEEGKRLEDESYREALVEGIWKGITQFGLASRIASTL